MLHFAAAGTTCSGSSNTNPSASLSVRNISPNLAERLAAVVEVLPSAGDEDGPLLDPLFAGVSAVAGTSPSDVYPCFAASPFPARVHNRHESPAVTLIRSTPRCALSPPLCHRKPHHLATKP